MSTPEQIQQLAALQACKDSSEQLQTVIAQNTKIAEENTKKNLAAGAAQVIWNAKKKDHDDKVERWKNRKGEYEKWKNYGVSEDFKIRWGGAGGDSSNECKGCAHRQLMNGWWNKDGKMAKNIGVVGQDQVCDLSHGEPLVGWDGYIDNNNDWGWDAWLSRKWWTCVKSDAQKTKELNEYNANNPGPFTEPYPEVNKGEYVHAPQVEIPQIAINCCSNYTNINPVSNSTVELTNFVQSCNQSIIQKKQEIESAAAAPAPVTATPPAPATAAPAPIQNKIQNTLYEDREEVEEEVEDSNKQKKIAAILFIVCILIILIFLSSATALFFV